MSDRFSDGLRSILFAGMWAAILVVAYLIVMNHEMCWDMNGSDQYGLSRQTKKIIHSLGLNIHIRAFEAQEQERVRIRNLLDLYTQESKAITYEIIDPDVNPGLARHLGIIKYGQAVLTGSGRETLIDATTEEEITNALIVLKQHKRKNIYFLTGHGESEISDRGRYGLFQLAEALRREGCSVNKLLLARQEDIPGDMDLLIIPSPRIDMAQKESSLLQDYIDKGGRILIALEPLMDGGLKPLLEGIGIGIDKDIITDPSSKALGSDDTVLVVDSYGGIRELSGFNFATVFPTSRILRVKDKLPPYITVSSLAKTSNQSRAGSDTDAHEKMGRTIPDSSVMKGPFDIALLVRIAISEDVQSQIMVFGDADFLTNTYLNISGNSALALNCINALLNTGQLMKIDSRQVYEKPYVLTPGRTAVLFLITVVFIPSLVLSLMVALRRIRFRG